MARGGGDQHDRIAGMHQPGTVNDQQPGQLPARQCLCGQRLHRRQGQRPVVLQFQRLDRVSGAHLADETGNSAGLVVGCGECRNLGGRIE